MSSRPPQRGAARKAGTTSSARGKTQAFRAAEAARARRRRLVRWGAIVAGVLVVAVAVTVGVLVSGNGGGHHTAAAAGSDKPSGTSSGGTGTTATSTLTGPPGPEGIVLEQAPLLAPASGAATGATVGGIQCNTMEQAVYHIHTHLTIYVNGALRAVPAGVGIVEPVAQQTPQGPFDSASHCYYWLHTHAQDGIIHIESPTHTTYTLGQFFGIWQQPLSASQVGPAHGQVTAFVNGTRYTGNPAAIQLGSREDVQLDVGTPVVTPKKIDWSKSQL